MLILIRCKWCREINFEKYNTSFYIETLCIDKIDLLSDLFQYLYSISKFRYIYTNCSGKILIEMYRAKSVSGRDNYYTRRYKCIDL